MAQERTASVVWEGNLLQGRGQVTLESSEVLRDSPITWMARTEEPGGMTSPEELLAAAQAGCFAMVVANEMTKRGHPPARVDLRATCSGDIVGGGWKVTGMDIDLAVAAPGVDEETFREVVAASEQGCPVSNALRGNVEIRVNAKLM